MGSQTADPGSCSLAFRVCGTAGAREILQKKMCPCSQHALTTWGHADFLKTTWQCREFKRKNCAGGVWELWDTQQIPRVAGLHTEHGPKAFTGIWKTICLQKGNRQAVRCQNTPNPTAQLVCRGQYQRKDEFQGKDEFQ